MGGAVDRWKGKIEDWGNGGRRRGGRNRKGRGGGGRAFTMLWYGCLSQPLLSIEPEIRARGGEVILF